jgi:hypothetical protein
MDWSADCIGRRANLRAGSWKIRLPDDDPLASLRLREVAFALLNPTHAVLRKAAIFLPAKPANFGTVHMLCNNLRVVLRWGREHALPQDQGQWDRQDWQLLVDEQAAEIGVKTLARYVSAVRQLRQLTPVLTGVSAFDDPWGELTAEAVAHHAKGVTKDSAAALATPDIPPQTWWPLLKNQSREVKAD